MTPEDSCCCRHTRQQQMSACLLTYQEIYNKSLDWKGRCRQPPKLFDFQEERNWNSPDQFSEALHWRLAPPAAVLLVYWPDIRYGRVGWMFKKKNLSTPSTARRNAHTRTTGVDLSDCSGMYLDSVFFFFHLRAYGWWKLLLFVREECRKPVRHFGTVRTQNEEVKWHSPLHVVQVCS